MEGRTKGALIFAKHVGRRSRRMRVKMGVYCSDG
jgi:hypothetical protein